MLAPSVLRLVAAANTGDEALVVLSGRAKALGRPVASLPAPRIPLAPIPPLPSDPIPGNRSPPLPAPQGPVLSQPEAAEFLGQLVALRRVPLALQVHEASAPGAHFLRG